MSGLLSCVFLLGVFQTLRNRWGILFNVIFAGCSANGQSEGSHNLILFEPDLNPPPPQTLKPFVLKPQLSVRHNEA